MESRLLGRPLSAITLSDQLRRELLVMVGERSLPQDLAQRARIILLAVDGLSNTAIALQLSLSDHPVGKWRRRFLHRGLTGLYAEAKPGGPRSINDEKVAALIRKTLKTKPQDATHWTVRALAAESSLSKSTVHRIWRAFSLQPHPQKHSTLSTDPFFVEKVRDLVGLYLNPPDQAMVLCVDENSQVQALLDRTQPFLPMGLGYGGGGDP